MAYIETRKRKNGVAYVVEFRRSGRVYKLSLDKTYNIKDARFIAAAIDSAIASEKKGAGLDAQTRLIFANLAPDMRRRLERVGLLAIAETMTLGEAFGFFEREYFSNLGEKTVDGYRRTVGDFIHFLNSEMRQVGAISADDAQRFVDALRSVYSPNTVHLRTARIKTFFRFLESKKIIDASPFNSIKTPAFAAGKRRYIDRETVERIAATLDPERRALLYLYRYAGLRRSEPYCLTFAHVDLHRRRLKIPTPKTARFAGKGERVAPISGSLLEPLTALVGERRDDGKIFTSKINPKIIQKFIPPGARPFQDMRVSCENDWLEARIPAHVVAAWLGHQTSVQAQHYAVVLDSYFDEIANG